MRIRFLVGAGFLASCASVALAQSDNKAVLIGPAPDWVVPAEILEVPDDAQGAIFFRSQETIVRLTETGQLNYELRLMRILNSQALQAGNVAITWNPAAGQPTVHSIKIIRGARTIDVLENTAFEILRREDQLEAAMLDGLLTATLRVPDLRVGDDLEIAYTVPANDPTLRETSHGMLFLNDVPPPGRFRLQLSWSEGQKPTTQVAPVIADVVQMGANSLTLDMDNPPTYAAPRNAPPRFQWGRIIEYSDFRDWQDTSRRFYALYDAPSRLTEASPLREEAAIIVETHTDKVGQMQAALNLVQQQVRYIYVGLNGGNFVPASADETWQRRYGDCKGKTVMLLALLRELGITAEPVLVTNSASSDGLDRRLPNPGHFDHVLVRAQVDGQSYWLDGTLPPVYEGRSEPLFPYQWVLPLSQAGSELERIPDAPFKVPQFLALTSIDTSAGFEASGQQTVTTVTRGLAGLQEYVALSSISANQFEASVRDQLAGSAEWDSIESVTHRFDRKTQANIVTITGIAPVNWEGEGTDNALALPGGGFTPPTRRVRPADSPADIPFYKPHHYSCYVTTVKLPAATKMKDWSFNSTIDDVFFGERYYRMMELRNDRTMRMVSSKRVLASEMSAQATNADNDRLDDFDNSKAFLEYDSFNGGWGKKLITPVPTVDEIDWTSPDAPCLPNK